MARPLIERMEERVLLHGGLEISVNFAPPMAQSRPDDVMDSGAVYGDRHNGLKYGWDVNNAAHVKNLTTPTVSPPPNVDYTSYAESFSAGSSQGGHEWKISLPNDTYEVQLVVGDGRAGALYDANVNGIALINGWTTQSKGWLTNTAQVKVTDGFLRISNGSRVSMNRLVFLDIKNDAEAVGGLDDAASSDPPPSVAPAAASTNPTLSWHQGANGPIPRIETQGLALGGKLYAIGGYYTDTPKYTSTARADAYDPATNTWSRLHDMPYAVTHAGIAAVGTNIYLAGGYTMRSDGEQNFASNKVLVYDTLKNSWSYGVPLPAYRGAGTMVAAGHVLYFISGVDASRADHNDQWALDLNNPAAGWKARAPLPAPRNHVSSAVIGGKIYVAGGMVGFHDQIGNQSTLFMYDIAANKWSSGANLPVARSHTCYSGFVWNNKFVVIGGRNDPSISLPYVSLYDPATNAWSSLTPLPHGLHGPVAGFVDGRFVATTGYYQVGGFNGFQSITYVSNVLSTTTAPNTPYLGKPFTKGQLIGAAQYDYGGEGVAYHDSTTANLGGDNLRPGTAVDIQAGGTTGHVIGHSAPGEWLDFTITVPAAGTYSLQANLANPGSGATFHAEFGGNLSGQNLTGPITIPNTGSWTTYKLVTSTSFTLPAGTTTMRIVLDKNSSANAVGNFDWFRIV